MFNVVYHILIFLFPIYTSNESEVLIEKCPSPWATYNTRISPLLCRSKCQGKAFRTKEGKLICFNVKDVSRPKPLKGPITSSRSSKNISCECVYFSPSLKLKWLPCENSFLETTAEICEEICSKTTVYLYKRSQLKTVLLCENEERNEYYDMVGQNGRIIYYENERLVKYRECTCGIASMELKPLIKVKRSLDSGNYFQQCLKPWETVELIKISNLETCKIHCQKICKRGSGIIHKGEAFCFMRHATAKKRSAHHGGVEGTCECGYVKKRNSNNYNREFVPCTPPITRNGLSGKKCVQFCSKSTAYIYQKSRQQLNNIRCIYKPEMKPGSLIGKCDEQHQKITNVTKTFTKCICGLENFAEGKILKNHNINFENNVEIRLPDSWLVKKKRSITSREKFKEETRKIK